jgi:autotransporter-associated beta strand protein
MQSFPVHKTGAKTIKTGFVESCVWLVGPILCLSLATVSAAAGDRQIIHGQVPRAVAGLQPLRRLETTNNLQLAIGLPLRNQAELTNLLQELYDPAGANYRHFLTPEEFAGRFGPTEEDYQALTEFARTNGLRVTGTHPNRMLLDVAGPVPAIEKAFQVKLQVYPHPTEAREFYAPETEPQLELAVPVLHISGLDNFVAPRPLCVPMPATARPAGAAPASGSGSGGNYAGKDFRAAYAPGVTNTGAGQAVGLLEFQGYYASDITAYETTYSLPAVPLNNVLLGGLASITTDAGDAECPLDIEMAISMAPGLSQVIVYCTTRSGNTDDILNRMATDNLAKQLSASWIVGADATALQIYQQFAVQGQSYFNASGDTDAGTASLPVGEDAPYITVVGGTTLSTSGAGGYWTSETTWNNGGGTGSTGGVSPTYGMPVWQQGISMDTNQGSAFMRNVPDVALTANNVWVLYNDGGSGGFGGTSCATPLWAGFLALVNQQAAANGLPSVGFLNPTLYALGKGTNYAATFHDITTGNNDWSESPNQYNAAPGYDLCTGWGTPTGSNLINALVFFRVDPLVITPTNGFTAAGPAGGPFTPASGVYAPANYGSVTTNWSLINTSAWCSVSPASGTLPPGGSANVTVTVGSAANSLPAGYYPATLLFSNTSTHVVQSRPLELVVGSSLTWDSTAGGGAPQDGGGIWADPGSGEGTTNWWNGADDALWANASPEVATFGAGSGTAGAVTLGGPVTAAGINFGTPGSGNYTIAGGGYTLTLDGAVSAGNSATISAPVNLGSPGTFNAAGGQTLAVSGLLSGAAGNALAINGPGTVDLSGTGASAAAGMAGAVTVNSGTLALSSGSSTYGALGNAAGITVGPGAVLSLQGANEISGSSGAARTLTVNNGMVTNSGGTRTLGPLTLNGATLAGPGTYTLKGDVFGSNAVISAQTVATVAGMSFNAGSGSTLAFSGTLTGSGGLTFAGPGTMIFSGTNSSPAGTTIRPGTLQVGTGGAGSSLGTGGVTNSGLLEFNRSDSFTWGVPVTDPNYLGSFIKLNTNTITLTATNNFLATSSGAIQVNGGTLQINPTGLLVSGAEFWVAENAATGACVLNGGTLIASNWLAVGRNSSAALGTLTVNSGVVQETGNGGNLIMGSLGGNGTLTVNGGAVSNNAAIWLGEDSTGKGTLNLNGGLVQATQVTRSTSPGLSAILNFNGGTLEAVTNGSFMAIDSANVLAGNAIIDDGGHAIAVSQGLLNGGGGGGLIKNGSGTLTLTATNNTYTGPTTVNSGTLKVSPDPVLHLSFDNVSGTNVINDGTGGSAMNGVLTGTATISTNGGRFGNALNIPSGAANAAYVLINNPVVAMTGAGSWTLGMWIKTSTAGGVYAYQGSGSWASGNMVFYLNESSDGGYGTKAGGVSYGQGWETGTTAINNGAWHFVVMTCNGTTKTMYLDGNAETIAHNWAAGTGVGSQLWIGGAADTGDEDVGLNGLIDEVYVFSRALSQTEVKSLMTYNTLGSRQVLPPATALTLAAGTTFDMSSFSQSLGSLAGASGSSVLLGSGTNVSNLTFSNTASTTFAGTISGNGSVTQNGPGSITFSGINTYAGSTMINAGTVALGQSNNSNLVATLQPLLWFTFSQAGGGVVTNQGTGGSALNGKLTGTASISSSGRYGNCLSIPSGAANAAYVLVNNPVVAMTGANAWTIGMWVKTSTAGGVYAYQGSGGWASGNMMFYLNEGSDGGYGTKAGGVSYAQGWEEGTTAINNNTWHFVVMTCNGSTKTMYLDGNADAITSSWAAGTGAGSQLWIGGSADTTDEDVALNGLIDEVYVFNRALSQTEVRNLMGNAPVDPVITTAGQLPAASPVSLAPPATLDLAGISQTVASLSDLGGGGLVTNSGGAPVVLALSNPTAATTTFSGEINDDNAATNSISVSMAGNGTQVLAGASAYSGTTTVSGGSLLVNGSLGTGTVTVTGGTLGGAGVINGPAILSGGTLAPGPSAISTFTFNAGLTLSGGGTTLMKINPALPANDQLAVTGALNYGGTLVLTNLGGSLVAGSSLKLFNAGSYTGAFASLTPASPGSGLAWNTNTLTMDGTLRVGAAAAPGIGVLTTSGNTFSLSITGGPPYSPWRVLSSGDLTVPPANWTPVWTNVFDANGDGQFTNEVDPAEPQQFFEVVAP